MEADNPDQLRVGLYPTDPNEFFRMAHEVILIAHDNIYQEREIHLAGILQPEDTSDILW